MLRSSAQVMQMMVDAIFIAAVLTGVRANAQAQSAPVQISAAPAGAIDPSKLPDIEGIHLGMSVDQASAIMKTLFPAPSHKLSVTAGRFMNAPDKPWITSMTGQLVTLPCNACADLVVLRLNTPPNPTQVVSVERTLVLADSQQPTLDATLAGLRQKYGPETQKSNNGTVMVTLSWMFDERGNHLPASTPQFTPGCAGTIAQPQPGGTGLDNPYGYGFVLASSPVTPQVIASMKANACRSHVYLRVELSLVGPGNSLVRIMAFHMSDNDLDTRDVIAGQQYLDGLAAARKQQQLKSAQQQSAPTL